MDMTFERMIMTLLFIVAILLFIFCWYTNIRLMPAEIEIDESGRIEAGVIRVDREGMTVQLISHTDRRYSFSAFFILHVKKGDTWYKWREKKNTTHEAVSIEYGVDPGSETEYEIEWPYWYEELKSGQYRVVLGGWYGRYGEEVANIAIEFEIK